MHDFPPSLAALVRRQHGLFTMRQAQRRGLSRATVDTLIRRGLLQRVDRGVLHHVTTPRTWVSEVLRLTLAGGPGAVASHATAAALWGIDGFRRGSIELTVPRGRRLRRAGACVHESTDLGRAHIVRREGVPTTNLARTILDLAARLPDAELALAIQWCRRERGLTWEQLASTLRRHARRGRPGVARLRRVIASSAQREEISDSALEELVIALLAESDLPVPTLHHRIEVRGRVVEIDLAYVAERVAIELDGLVHTEVEVFRADRRRQNLLVLDGWLILRFTWHDYVTDPERIIREVRSALGLAATA